MCFFMNISINYLRITIPVSVNFNIVTGNFSSTKFRANISEGDIKQLKQIFSQINLDFFRYN